MHPRRRRYGSETEPSGVITGERSWFPQSVTVYNTVPDTTNLLDDFEDHTLDPIAVMSARDRTNEFVKTIQTLQGRDIARAVAIKDPRKSKVIQSHSEFMLIAKNVGRNIASTFAKLEKLTLRNTNRTTQLPCIYSDLLQSLNGNRYSTIERRKFKNSPTS